jgi:HAD superfamily hydrolase (TIGR01509 family)
LAERLDIKAVIFDLDGLVLDTESSFFAAWRQAAKVLGFELSESFCRSLSGLHYRAVERKLCDFYGAGFDPDEFGRISALCWRRHVQAQGIAVKPGFQDLLELIVRRNLPYALATNSNRANALECLDMAGLTDVFQVIVARDEVAQGKPDPAVFWAVAKRLSVAITQCLVLEDSPVGIMAAKAAGAFALFVPSTQPADSDTLTQCDLNCHDLTEVAQWLGRI